MEDEDDMDWCFSENGPFSLEELGDDAWLTGCPLCGDQCYSNPSPSQLEEREQYFKDQEGQ